VKTDMKTDMKADIEFLTSKGWKFLPYSGPWCWVQPGTVSRWRFEDALDNQRALDRSREIKKS
jgi:hypothetical protein